MGDKSVILKTDFRVWKKQTVRCFRKNTPKNQTEFKRIEAIYIAVVVLFLHFLFLIILFYILFYFIYFLPLTFSGMHMHTVHTGSYAPALCLLNNIIYDFLE